MSIPAAVKKTRRFLHKYHRLILLIAAILGVVFLILYFRAFFHTGIDWNGELLSRSKEKSTVVYSGSDKWSDITISVNRMSDNEVDVSYRFLQNKVRTYKLTIGNEEDFWRTVLITGQDGTVLFNGRYQKGNSFLYDRNKLPAQGDVEVPIPTVNPYLDFSPNYRVMVGIAMGEYDHIKGDGWLLLIGLLLAALVVVDIRKPLLTVSLRSYLIGDKPQRADMFELVQVCVRTVILLVAVGFLLAAL